MEHEHGSESAPASDARQDAARGTGGPGAEAAEVLQLQATIGNRATTAMLQRSGRVGSPVRGRPGRQLVQRGFWSAIGHGLDVYSGIPDSDPGKPFAQELMRWRMLGMGSDFIKRGSADSDWNQFMLDRPELQRAMVPVFKKIAEEQAALGPSGSEWMGGYRNISKDITGVRLNELESMRLTLHGCHRIEIRGRAHTAQDGANWVVSIWPKITWVDRAAMHPGTATVLDTGAQIDDSSFTAAGWDYDERIMFELVGTILHPDASSKWRVSGGTATHLAGWPPEPSVTPPSGSRS